MTSREAGGDLASVVVPVRDEERSIDACLRSIRAQTHEDLEILVVEGGSEDRTREIVRSHAEQDDRIRLLDNPDAIIPAALNVALRAVSGRWFIRIDAHATVPPRYVQHIVDRLREGWGGVGGRKDAVGRTPTGRAIAVAMGSRFGVGGSVYHYGTDPQQVEHVPFGAYPVELARELGGWDEELTSAQDVEFDQRVVASGRRLLFDPGIRIDWECRRTVAGLFHQYRRYGMGKARVVAKHPDVLTPRIFLASGLVGALTTALVALPVAPTASAVLAGPYAVALGVGSVIVGWRLDSWWERAVLPAAFAAMHVGGGVGFLQGVAGVLWERITGRRGWRPAEASRH